MWGWFHCLTSKDWSAGFAHGAPTVAGTIRGLRRTEAGALAVLAPTARKVALRVKRLPGAAAAFRKALQAGRAQGALAGRIRHGSGRIPAGEPMVVIAALARSRRDALIAVETMLNALKGVAERRDESKA